ncbi:MAG TPA: histidine kinase [Lentisphaeria bacterium]|nr:MAG: hypothetical protein A2X47_02985 [Lentisphaerae bacterium GWF2_38_69]HBM15352.1 histidine kinase [Lentisphaeria bacterium]
MKIPNKGNIKTFFADAERLPLEEVKKQAVLFSEGRGFEKIVDKSPIHLLILNRYRQILFANKSFSILTGIPDFTSIIGLRVGESLRCIYSDVNKEGGCGTSEYCRYCGGTQTILRAINSSFANEGECSIIRKDNTALNFRVTAEKIEISGQVFVGYWLVDISMEKLYSSLQKIFFHDIANIAGGISGLSEIIFTRHNSEACTDYAKLLKDASGRLVADIERQRELNMIVKGDVSVSPCHASTLKILKSVYALYLAHEVSHGKTIKISLNAKDLLIVTDEALLMRVIGNMTKNALEASKKGQKVELNCIEEGENVKFSVKNESAMPEKVKLQIFKRFFSTKGSDRGIGTYSMKLIGENFLKGSVYFESDESGGTTFYIKIPKVLKR